MSKCFFGIIQCVFIITVLPSCSNKDKEKNGDIIVQTRAISTEAPSKLGATEYMNWIENVDNGIKVEKKMGEFTFTAMYKPLEYLALIELKKDNISKKELEKYNAEYSDLQYFTFRISAENQKEELLKVGLKSENDYYSRIEYFSFKMQNDLKLIDGKDTLDCALFHFERVYGLAPYATFVIGFPLTKEEGTNTSTKKNVFKNKTILYDEKVFQLGKIYMTIKEDNLNRIPELITH